MAWLKLGSAGVFYPGPALELSGFLGYLTPLASRWGVGLDVIEVPRRWGLALVVDVDFGETVAEPVDVVAGHQGQGVDPGIPGRFGITFFVSPSSAGQEPPDDVNEKQGCGRDEEDGPVSEARTIAVAVHVHLDEARARVLLDAGWGGWLDEGDWAARWCLTHGCGFGGSSSGR